jgi:hypothetical protein
MSFLRHVGKHGERKVAVIFREVPGEPHMALVTYTDLLNRHIHDPMMQCIESTIGQQSENLADALNRQHTADGKYILQVLHSQGLIKKVQTSQIVMTPNSNTTIRLDELNKILDEMQQGEEAVKRLAELDSTRGIQDPVEIARRHRGQQVEAVSQADGILGDSALANNLLQQAQRMAAEAKGLLAESARLEQQANEMLGVPVATQTTITSDTPVKRGRGRPAKVKAPAL